MNFLRTGHFFGDINKTIRLSGITQTNTDSDYPQSNVDWHYHENAYFTLILQGKIIEGNKRKSYDCSAGSLLFHDCQEPHFNFKPDGNTGCFHIELDKNCFADFAFETSALQGIFRIENPDIKFLLYQVFSETRILDDAAAVSIQMLLLEIFGRMLRFRQAERKTNDNNPETLGYEDNMWEQTAQPDFYKWTLALKMIREPGEKAIYCSANANLVGVVVARAAGQTSQMLFRKLLGEPLEMKRYYLPLSPAGDYTMTGGARFLPRDFMKLGQVHLNGGTWNGRRIFTPEWSRRATSPLYYVDAYKESYGYLWWVIEYPYQGRKIRAFYAGGNGGQVVMVIPELDLVMAFYGGNYNNVGGRTSERVYVPEYILPAIDKQRAAK